MCCRVDYRLYPGLADVEYYRVSLSAGDCLYVPYKWSVSLALSLLFLLQPVEAMADLFSSSSLSFFLCPYDNS